MNNNEIGMKEIEVIAAFAPEKLPTPIRFRIETEEQELMTVKIDKILFAEEDKKEKMIKYRCVCTVNDLVRVYDLYYMKEHMKWYLK